MSDYELAEILRRLDSIVRTGTVEKADYKKGLVRVRSKGLLTDWIPWSEERTGKDRTWSPPDIGEQVTVLCPSGDPAQGRVMRGGYQDKSPQNSQDPDVVRTDYSDGSFIEHNRATGKLHIHATGDIEIVAEGNVQITGTKIDLN